LSLIDGFSSGLKDGDNRVLGYMNAGVLGALPERLARATAETYCMAMVNIKYYYSDLLFFL
jgi:hypothetical protein